MVWVIYFFGSGAAFFAGVGFVFAALALFIFFRRNWSTGAATLVALFGLILIGLSATPFPNWFYLVGGLVSLLWLVAERVEREFFQKRRRWIRLLVFTLLQSATLAEIRYHVAPTLKPIGQPRLYIFADSVTAGMGEAAVETWPILLARLYSIEVQDHSQMGAKVSSMLRKAEKISLGAGVVLLEIGGNDLLGTTSASDFERDLDQLLGKLCGPDRTVVMFELPLPPFGNEFGRAQRRLAQKHGVQLVPKRIFVGVLTAEGATVDSVHLSPSGHELMAETVWGLIQQAFVE